MFEVVLRKLSRPCELSLKLFTSSTVRNDVDGLRGVFCSGSQQVIRRMFSAYSTTTMRQLVDVVGGFSPISTGPTMLTTNFNKYRSCGGERIFR